MLKMLSLMKCYIKNQCVLNQQPNMIFYRLKIRENRLDSTRIIKSFIYIKKYWLSCVCLQQWELASSLSTFLPLLHGLCSQNSLTQSWVRPASVQADSDPENCWSNQLIPGENIHTPGGTLSCLQAGILVGEISPKALQFLVVLQWPPQGPRLSKSLYWEQVSEMFH